MKCYFVIIIAITPFFGFSQVNVNFNLAEVYNFNDAYLVLTDSIFFYSDDNSEGYGNIEKRGDSISLELEWLDSCLDYHRIVSRNQIFSKAQLVLKNDSAFIITEHLNFNMYRSKVVDMKMLTLINYYYMQFFECKYKSR